MCLIYCVINVRPKDGMDTAPPIGLREWLRKRLSFKPSRSRYSRIPEGGDVIKADPGHQPPPYAHQDNIYGASQRLEEES